MKVKDFKKLIENIDPEKEVILAKDSEGNGFSPVTAVSFAYYVPINDYLGEIYDQEDIERDGKPENLQNAVFLWPTN